MYLTGNNFSTQAGWRLSSDTYVKMRAHTMGPVLADTSIFKWRSQGHHTAFMIESKDFVTGEQSYFLSINALPMVLQILNLVNCGILLFDDDLFPAQTLRKTVSISLFMLIYFVLGITTSFIAQLLHSVSIDIKGRSKCPRKKHQIETAKPL